MFQSSRRDLSSKPDSGFRVHGFNSQRFVSILPGGMQDDLRGPEKDMTDFLVARQYCHIDPWVFLIFQIQRQGMQGCRRRGNLLLRLAIVGFQLHLQTGVCFGKPVEQALPVSLANLKTANMAFHRYILDVLGGTLATKEGKKEWNLGCPMFLMTFSSRSEAGHVLSGLLKKYSNRPNTVVLALPRGGVVVGYEIAKALRLPLDVFVVRKLGLPGYEELAMGAVASGGVRYIHQDIIDTFHVDARTVDAVSAREETEIARREHVYRGQRPSLDVRGKTVILVDDGLATGSTMRAAIFALRQGSPERIVVAVPTGSREVSAAIHREADETVCATMPDPFYAVSQSYKEFPQTADYEVRELLARSSWAVDSTHFSIPIDGAGIQGDLTVSADSKGFVIFAHGSGSSRHSPRNKYVARILNRAGLATLLVDLLTAEEEMIDMRTSGYRFNIDLLANRLVIATDWLVEHRTFSAFPVGLFGASTGAAAALVAAAARPNTVRSIVSRGGRPDLAGEALRKVVAPTLFVVGELDHEVLELNRHAAGSMSSQTEIQLVRGATHLFEEPGALDQVASLARHWFTNTLIHKRAA